MTARPIKRIAWTLAIVLISAAAGMTLNWRAPGIDRYTRDWLMRARGPIPAPDDIAIVAIDEPSIARFGRFPWPRSVLAKVIDALSIAKAKVIAVDVLFTEPTDPREDATLAAAIRKAGNVVAAAQLIETQPGEGAPRWLAPLPPILEAAAGVGHVSVLAESEGIARELLVRQADNSGLSFRAMPIETVRIGDGLAASAIDDSNSPIRIGQRVIPVSGNGNSLIIDPSSGAQVMRAFRVSVDYIGPTGSFDARTYSLADVVDGKAPASRFAGRYVLIGATAASLGDRLASPFVHQPDARGDQHGTLMPGVEVLANAVNTILRSRFRHETPDGLAFLLAAIVAAGTLEALRLAQGRRESLKQMGTLFGIAGGIVILGYIAFTRLMVYPPMVPAMTAFAAAGLLGLLRRSLLTSSELDAALGELARSGQRLAPMAAPDAAAESIAQLTEAAGIAIFVTDSNAAPRSVAAWGVPLARESNGEFVIGPGAHQRYRVNVEPIDSPTPAGYLVLACDPEYPASRESRRLAMAIAASCVATSRIGGEAAGRWWPRDLESKARRLSHLNQQLIERARFVDYVLRSVEEGLLIAGPDGSIAFANAAAASMLGSTPQALAGRSLLERIAGATQGALELREELERLLIHRSKIEREVTISSTQPRRCMLRIAAVSATDSGGPVLGMVASLSDITAHDGGG